ncbi:hypothetical protein Patl1_34794 [Pistacia atlantica]|uniref:Uncharacterized protein n=1 Tax=Pistacia atlantica TaxID=434234 RepID=A0ACC0ZRG7_9ROSI|nr:hypothetical protein Patl1_34794 [Pistacia atlantica]
MEFLGTCLDILKCIGPPLCTYIEYHRKLQENFNNLKRELDGLNSQKKDVEETLKAESERGKLPKEEVSNWLRYIETITGEVENIEKEVNRKKFFSRVRLSKLVEEKIQKVKKYEQKRSSYQSLVIDTPPARGLILSTMTLIGENTRKNMEEIWAHLMGNGVTKIGVCGIGGVGKTTIITHINNRLVQEKGKFDHVIWVTVSQPFDLAKLQDQIASMFNRNFEEAKDQKIRAGMLLRMFEGKRFVLILDDMWESFSLEEVGTPQPTKGNGCKVMITTRSIDVCRSMGCKVVRVEPLAKHEALKLFVDKVEVNIIEVPTLKELMELIVDQCAGLPLAVVTIAGCMKGVDDICEWRNAFNEFYDRLKHKKLQHCFLYCALYPEDFKIPKEELIDYWIAEGLVDERASMQAMYDEMHDLIREMALYITSMSPLFMVKAGEKLQELPREQEWKQNLEKFVVPPKDLQCLTLYDCDNVRSLSDVLSDEGEYSDLKAVYIYNCPSLKKLLSAKLLRASPNLEVIEVVSCHEIEEIITLDGPEEKSEEDGRSNTTLTLPKLKILGLLDLPELKRICSSNGVMVCDSLEQIVVVYCPKLKRLPLSLPLPAIKEIKVEVDWWNSLEWDNPNAKNALQPYIKDWW